MTACSFPVGTFGSQKWDDGNCGNGYLSSNNDKIQLSSDQISNVYDTVDPGYVQSMINYYKSRGTPIKYWSLDNEYDIWHATHQDSHYNPVTYDELWSVTQAYAKAAKEADPTIIITGPVVSGWCGYKFSPADGCQNGGDKAAHGNLDAIEWYIKQGERKFPKLFSLTYYLLSGNIQKQHWNLIG
jgi:hypothetical protein